MLGVATSAMEMRGGNGYIEDRINACLVRNVQIGVLWEGTSNIDAIGRAGSLGGQRCQSLKFKPQMQAIFAKVR
jgi:alkylation response protein AidB-like acyl-CoA dehydrogenase